MKDQEEPKAEFDVAFDKPSSSSSSKKPEHRDGSNGASSNGASSSESKAYEEGVPILYFSASNLFKELHVKCHNHALNNSNSVKPKDEGILCWSAAKDLPI